MSRHRFRTIVILVILTLFTALPALAGEDIEVVVTAARMAQPEAEAPVTVDVVTSEEIEEMQARNVGEALRLLPGVEVRSQGSLGTLTTMRVRGAASSQVLVLLDGRPVNSAQGGVVDLADLTVIDVERIELMRGPASSLYGAFALGGVINIITRKDVEPQTAVAAGLGEQGTSLFSLFHSGNEGRFSYNISAENQAGDGFRPNSAYDSESYSGRLSMKLAGDAELSLSARAYSADKGVPGMESYPTPLAKQKNDNSYLALSWMENGAVETKIDLYRNAYDLRYRDEDPWYPIDTEHRNRALGLQVQQSADWRGIKALYGMEMRSDTVDSLDLGAHDATTLALFLQGERRLSDRLSLTAGGRYDSQSIYGSQVSPRLGVNYRMPGGTLRASVGQGFRPPVFDDLYWPYQFSVYPDWMEPNIYYEYITRGNPDLVPEHSTAWEIGFEKAAGSVQTKAAFFRQEVSDLIRWAATYSERTEGDDTYYTYDYAPVNIGQALLQGAEVELSAPLSERWDCFLNYSWLDAVNREDGSRLPYSPESTFTVGVGYDFDGFSASLSSRTVGRQLVSLGSSVSIPAYSRVDLRLGRSLGNGLEASLGVDNLFDSRYYEQDGYPAPGRLVNGRLKWSF